MSVGAVVLPVDGAVDGKAAWSTLPARAGVAQLLGHDGRPLLTSKAPNLRRFVAGKLASPKAPAPGRRPPLDLRPLVRAVRHVVTTSPFHQRLTFERLMAAEVPLHKRRDLKPPVYLRLDATARFPRVELALDGAGPLFGPLRDRRCAERASKALHKLVPLRPCDYDFEPRADWAPGLACLYAQVRTCAAPCLARVGEDEYRALACRAVGLLGDPGRRSDEVLAWLPAYVARADGPALVLERVQDAVEIYPLRDGAVLEDQAVRGAASEARARAEEWAAALLRASAADLAPRDDRRWLAAHFYARPRSTTYLSLADEAADATALAARLRALLSSDRD